MYVAQQAFRNFFSERRARYEKQGCDSYPPIFTPQEEIELRDILAATSLISVGAGCIIRMSPVYRPEEPQLLTPLSGYGCPIGSVEDFAHYSYNSMCERIGKTTILLIEGIPYRIEASIPCLIGRKKKTAVAPSSQLPYFAIAGNQVFNLIDHCLAAVQPLLKAFPAITKASKELGGNMPPALQLFLELTAGEPVCFSQENKLIIDSGCYGNQFRLDLEDFPLECSPGEARLIMTEAVLHEAFDF